MVSLCLTKLSEKRAKMRMPSEAEKLMSQQHATGKVAQKETRAGDTTCLRLLLKETV